MLDLKRLGEKGNEQLKIPLAIHQIGTFNEYLYACFRLDPLVHFAPKHFIRTVEILRLLQ